MAVRKGAAALDWAIGLTVFFVFVTLIFFSATQSTTPADVYHEPLRIEGQRIVDDLTDSVSITIYRIPVTITSSASGHGPFSLYFDPEANTDMNSLGVLDSDDNEVPFEYDTATKMFTWNASFSGGTDTYWTSYSKSTNITALAYTNDISISSTSMNNSKIHTEYDVNNMSRLLFNGSEIVDTRYGILLPITQAFTITEDVYSAKNTYPDGTNFKLYNDSSIIHLSDFASDVVINLNGTTITKFYDGIVHNFNATDYGESAPYQHTKEFIDFYGDDFGIAIMGSSLEVSVYNYDGPNYRRINITNLVDFEMYVHQGDYNQALYRNQTFNDPPTAFLGSTTTITGFYQPYFYNISITDYATLRSLLGIEDVDFKMTIEESA